jgi:hypothetical protein
MAALLWMYYNLLVLQVCFEAGAGAIALAVVARSIRRGTRDWFIPVCAFAGTLLLLNALMTLTKLHTWPSLLNLLFSAGAFVAYGILTTAAWSIRPRIVGIAAGTVALASLIVPTFSVSFLVTGAIMGNDLQAVAAKWMIEHLIVLQVCFQVGAGAVALAVVARSIRRGTRDWFIPVCALAGALLLLNALMTLTKLDTSSPLLNLLFPAAAFVAYGILATAAWSIRPRIVGIAAGTVALVSLIVPMISMVGLVVGADNDLKAPLYAAQIRPGVSCEGREWGYYNTVFHGVALYRYVPGFPFVRFQVASRSERETGTDSWPPNSTGCAKLAAEVHL